MVLHYKYCPQCGAKLGEKLDPEEGMIPYCESCGRMWFDSYESAAIVLVANEYNEVCMTLQPHLTRVHYVFTSGFIAPGETAEHCAVREIKEELDLDVNKLENLGTYWFKRGGMLMHAFIAHVNKKEFICSDEVETAIWVDVKKAAELMGPVRPGCADFFMMAEFVERNGLCTAEDLWPGQVIE